MTLINYNTKTHREVFGKVIEIEEIAKIGCSFYLFDKSEYVYIGKGNVYSHENGLNLLTSIFPKIRNVRKNGLIIAKRKGVGRKLVSVRFVRKQKQKKSKIAVKQ